METRVGEEEIGGGGLLQGAMHGRPPRGRWEEAVRGEVDPIKRGGRVENSREGYVLLEHNLSASSLHRRRESKVSGVRRESLLVESSPVRIRLRMRSTGRRNSFAVRNTIGRGDQTADEPYLAGA